MKRRDVLKLVGLTGLLGGCRYFDGQVWNQCQRQQHDLSEALRSNPLLQQVLQGLDGSRMIDAHVHLVGVGHGHSGIWVNPNQYRWYQLKQQAQMQFYLNAACVEDAQDQDAAYVAYLRRLNRDMPAGHRMMLLAFDYAHDTSGRRLSEQSAFYVPNAYAAALAQRYPQDFVWCASIHPYRDDALDELAWCVAHGAKAVKWLPPAMGIDPMHVKSQQFCRALAQYQIPLLTHAGAEQAVKGVHQTAFANPLRFRACLDQGATIILSHCASDGDSVDLDDPNAKIVPNFTLFQRLMDNADYRSNLYGDISAITLLNRTPDILRTLLQRDDWHPRLLQGSDFPLPAVPLSIAVNYWQTHQLFTETEAEFLKQLRYDNPLLFDLACKRLLSWQEQRFSEQVFMPKLLQDAMND